MRYSGLMVCVYLLARSRGHDQHRHKSVIALAELEIEKI